jgi:hypothetical protein
MWEFLQEEGMAAIGQFDLKIWFRIPKISDSPNGIIKHKYCIDSNVEVNRNRLVDHDIDREANCNMKVNGKCLMDKGEKKPYNIKMFDEDRCYQYWNVPLPYDVIDEIALIEQQKEERQPCKDVSLKMMNEEDYKAERLKLLRPFICYLN